MTYSKGPWIYDAESGEIHTKDRTGFWGPDHEPAFVATVEPMDGVNNGPLLAAAPELLEAAKAVTGMLELFIDEQRVKEATDGCYRRVEEGAAKLEALRAAIAKVEAMQ